MEEQVYSVLERSNRSGDRVTRALAVGAFGTLRPKDTTAYAVDALKDPVFEVRAAAVGALITLKNKAYEPVLLDDMKNPRVDFTGQIMPLLDRLDDKAAIALARNVLDDPKAPTRNVVIEAFAKAGGKRAVALFKPIMTGKDAALAEAVQGYVLTLKTAESLPLVELVLNVGSASMQSRALETLAEMPAGTSIKSARKLLKSKDVKLAVRAAEVLARHGDATAAKLLLPIVQSGDEAAVLRALTALAPIANKSMYPAMARYLRKAGTNPDIMAAVVEIHYRTKDPKLLDTLRKFRRNDDIRTQALAVYYLGLVERGRALPTLHQDLFHGDAFVRKAAIGAIGDIGSRESIPPLRRALDGTRDPQMRTLLVEAVAGIKDREIIGVLQFMITDRVAEVRRWAIIGLARVGHKDAVSSLKIAVNDSDIDARAEAVKAIMQLDKTEGPPVFRMALGWLPPEKLEDMAKVLGAAIVPYLNQAVTNSRDEIWRKALELLKVHPKAEAGILNQAFDRTRSSEVKVGILKRLVALRGAAELERLAALTAGKDPMVREAAFRLMGTLRDPAADAVLRKGLFESNERLRVVAARSLIALHGGSSKKKTRRRGKKR
ncbi:MAG: HEAT repeat protein [Myxococcota bacterium]